MLSIFKNFFGDKAARDLKEVMPTVKKIHEAYETIKNLSNDELREKTAEFRIRIANHLKEETSQIESQKKDRFIRA
jgi:preprotein translocase subunit SecA